MHGCSSYMAIYIMWRLIVFNCFLCGEWVKLWGHRESILYKWCNCAQRTKTESWAALDKVCFFTILNRHDAKFRTQMVALVTGTSSYLLRVWPSNSCDDMKWAPRQSEPHSCVHRWSMLPQSGYPYLCTRFRPMERIYRCLTKEKSTTSCRRSGTNNFAVAYVLKQITQTITTANKSSSHSTEWL